MKNFSDIHSAKSELKPEPKFVFTSKDRSLIASGICRKISNNGLNQDAFIDEIKNQLNELKSSGHENPIAIGAIPFDTNKETDFFVPEYSAFSSALALNKTTDSQIAQFTSLSQVTGENHFKGAVTKALSLSEHTHLNKVVLSRAIDVQTSTTLDTNTVVNTLYQQNPNAFVFSIPQSDGSTLIGASPELLIKKQGKRVTSNPLAGSRKRTASAAINKKNSNELWRCQKDRYEHKLVADAVSMQLAPFCQTLETPTAPSIIETSTMLHLSTKIDGRLTSKNTSVLELVYALHPTPAVCGTPLSLAKATIDYLEGYDRAQFCGAVGWMDADGNGEWVVTIRCGVIKQNSIRLYAGAGIVNGSMPTAEFDETEAKLNTMLKALGLKLIKENNQLPLKPQSNQHADLII